MWYNYAVGASTRVLPAFQRPRVVALFRIYSGGNWVCGTIMQLSPLSRPPSVPAPAGGGLDLYNYTVASVI